MSRIAFYQKYRSKTFDEVVGQEYVVRSIQNAVREGKVGHAYLFCGPRGTGKTTMARLLAKAVNCENPAEAPCNHCPSCEAANNGTHPDIIEINAANETHVEDIRDLIERARLAPMMSRHKVYIIDEVHQLSSSAASALLKTLEEPPEHVIFILATTDPQKLINTIISRCQRFDFTKVPAEKIQAHLLDIAAKEGFGLEENAARKIAELSDGGVRDALSILEQVSSYAGEQITEEQIDRVYGLSTTQQKLDLLACMFSGDMAGTLKTIQSYEHAGMDLKRLTSDLVDCLKDGVVWRCTKDPALLRVLNGEQAGQISSAASARTLLAMVDRLLQALEQYKQAQSVTTILEVASMELLTMNQKEPALTPDLNRVRPMQSADTNTTAPAPAPEPEPVTQPEPEPLPAEPALQPETESGPEESGTDTDEAAEEPAAPADSPAAQPSAQPQEPVELSSSDVVELLVQCDKNSKTADAGILSGYLEGVPMDAYAAMLKTCQLKASGKDVIVFQSSPAAARHLNEPVFNQELYFWLKNKGIDKMPYGVSEERYEQAVQEFRKLWKAKALPEKKAIHRYAEADGSEEKKEEKDPLVRVQNLFGVDQVEVK